VEGNSGLADYLNARRQIFGHLSNLPDNSWRNGGIHHWNSVRKASAPLHHIDVEKILGLSEDNRQTYAKKIRQIPADFAKVKERFEGRPGPLTPHKALKLYEDLGLAPWYGQDLFNEIVRAFTCAQDKKLQDKIKEVKSLILPSHEPKSLQDVPFPTYRCMNENGRLDDIYSATVIAGYLSHFVADLSQPLHVSVDYDGWVEGQGGIHAYFETEVVNALDEELIARVAKLARTSRGEILARFPLSLEQLKEPGGVSRALLALAADSWLLMPELLKIDRERALVRNRSNSWDDALGTRITLADNPHNYPRGSLKKAQRISAHTPAVMAAFAPMIEERLALAVVVLSRLWEAAYTAAGSPLLTGIQVKDMPYPFQPPFIWPSFDREGLGRILSGLTSSDERNSVCVYPTT
jgi:hypothetical protein